MQKSGQNVTALPTYFEVINYLNFAPYFFIAFLLVLTCIVSVPIYCCKKLTWCSSILRVLVFCATILFGSVTRKYKWKLDHLRWTNYKPVFTEQKQQNGDQHLKLRSV
ncbi:hypothetical protein MAR_004450 [Mya arenaria]|uniref:ATP synthase F0 subunit 8 n=1 Tax=Mya arenaria TaxID=6604 RepID=A0ABY7EWL3_MYAAR|nr:hypothetical protein MAR_004450 [Mya arenaria]